MKTISRYNGIKVFFKLLMLTLIVSSVGTLTSCRGGERTEAFSESLYRPEEASGFEILGSPGSASVLIRSAAPWQGADSTDYRELLILRGGEDIPSDFKGQVLKGNAERVICMSSGHIAMLSLLGNIDNIVGGSSLDFVSSPEIQSRRGELAEVGFEGAIDYEALVAARPDLVILYGVNSANPMEARLADLGIPYIYIGDYLEQSPLGKAEWMVALGECLGKREEAVARFQPIKKNYLAMKQRVNEAKDRRRPKVMLNGPYGDQWMMPSADNYIVRLISDAGGEYIYPENMTGASQPISRELALRLASASDRWLNVGNGYDSFESLRSGLPLMASTEVVKKGEVYNNTKRSTIAGGNDFYESGIVNPDLILRDMIKIMYPDLVSEPFFYYRRLTQ